MAKRKTCKARKIVEDDDTFVSIKLKGEWRNKEIKALRDQLNACCAEFLTEKVSTEE